MYVVQFIGLFEQGYVTTTIFRKSGTSVRYNTIEESLKYATKFRFKFIATIICRMCQYVSTSNFHLRTFSVKETHQNK